MDIRKRKSSPPLEYILTLKDELQTIFKPRNTKHKEYHDWRYRKMPIHIPENFRKATGYKAMEHRSPIVGELASRSGAILSSAPPEVKQFPLGALEKHRKSSTLVEKWLTAAYTKMDRGRPCYSELTDSFVETGMGVRKVILDRHEWGGLEQAEEEEAKVFNQRAKDHHRKHFPFKWTNIHPSIYYPVGDGSEEVLIITKRRARLVALRYNLKPYDGKLVKPRDLGPAGPDSNWPQTVDFTEYWNHKWCVYVVDNTIVEKVEHNYGRPPFFVSYAVPTISLDIEDQSISYLDSLIPTARAISNIVTILMNWFQINGFPTATLTPRVEWAEPIDTAGEGHVVEIVPGGLSNIPWGHDFQWEGAPQIGNTAGTLMNFFTNQYKESSLAPVLMGESPGSDVSGTALVTIVAIAKSIFAPGLQSIEAMYNEMAKFILRRIEFDLKEPVPIRATSDDKDEWLELGPDDIDGYWEVEHSVSPVIPAELYQNYTMTADAYARGLATALEAIEARGVSNPEEIMVEILADQYTKLPQFMQPVMQEVMRRIWGDQQPPPAPMGTQAEPPVAPGGPGAAVVPGIGRPMMPGGPQPVR